MASSSMEFYRKGDVGKLAINWRGRDNGGAELFHPTYDVLQTVKKIIIVGETSPPHTAASFFRFILQIVREAQRLGVKAEVVLPDEEVFDAAEITGFSAFFRVFLNEAQALEQLDIKNFYPLTLVKMEKDDPDPLAA